MRESEILTGHDLFEWLKPQISHLHYELRGFGRIVNFPKVTIKIDGSLWIYVAIGSNRRMKVNAINASHYITGTVYPEIYDDLEGLVTEWTA